MRKIILLLLIPIASWAQNTGVEMMLVNQQVGTPLSNWGATTSNDQGLNSILQSYPISEYTLKGGNPYSEYEGRIIQIKCVGCNLNGLKADLEAYSSVVAKAYPASQTHFINTLSVVLQNAAVGTPTGTTANIATTNDSGLNQIFQNFNVRSFDPAGSPVEYKLSCDCDNTQLKMALDNYNNVVQSTGYNTAAYLLSNEGFKNINPKIYPNPFNLNFQIETNATISNYSLYDISGKLLISTDSKSRLDNQSGLLSNGAYFLKLTFDNNQNYTQKLIKI
ncbi:hypothetical protein ABH942_002907 [Flavobacterium sp. 28YEA47A]|uniref:T9SS type A sorting domain-containing protein n=1 Tax=Flavobacterium sp. 28YEA47A TaxID=3156276 RepID=UPI0035162FA8